MTQVARRVELTAGSAAWVGTVERDHLPVVTCYEDKGGDERELVMLDVHAHPSEGGWDVYVQSGSGGTYYLALTSVGPVQP